MSVEPAVHEPVGPSPPAPPIGEVPPAVSQFCFWFVSVGTLTPVLLTCMVMVFVSVSAANAMRPFPKATVLTAITVAIATIALALFFGSL